MEGIGAGPAPEEVAAPELPDGGGFNIRLGLGL